MFVIIFIVYVVVKETVSFATWPLLFCKDMAKCANGQATIY